MASGVYAIRNRLNEKRYVGSSLDIDARLRQHQKDLRKGKHHSIKLLRAWQKHGSVSFAFEVLEVVTDSAQIIQTEQKWIDYFQAATRAGYNVAKFAGASGLGMECSLETRAKLSEAGRGRTHTEEARAKMRFPRSPEQRKRMGDSRRGQKRTPEQRAMFSAIKKGVRQSLETRAKISATMKGLKKSVETRARMSAAQKGIPCLPGERARMSATKKARFVEMKSAQGVH